MKVISHGLTDIWDGMRAASPIVVVALFAAYLIVLVLVIGASILV